MYIKLGKNHKGRSILKQELQVIPKEKCNALPDSNMTHHSKFIRNDMSKLSTYTCTGVVLYIFQVIFVFVLFFGMVIFTDEAETKEKFKITWDKKLTSTFI